MSNAAPKWINNGPADPTKISLSSPQEIGYWTRSLGASEKDLKEAVRFAGTSSKAVRRYLLEKRNFPAKTGR